MYRLFDSIPLESPKPFRAGRVRYLGMRQLYGKDIFIKRLIDPQDVRADAFVSEINIVASTSPQTEQNKCGDIPVLSERAPTT